MVFGIGILAGGLILSAWGGFRKRIVNSFWGLVISHISVIIFGFTTQNSFFMGLSMWLLVGLSNAFVYAPIGAIVQSMASQDMQGRVFSVLGSICTAVIPAGLAIAGPIGNAIELRWMYIFSGIILLVLTLDFFFFGKLMDIENQNPADKPVEKV